MNLAVLKISGAFVYSTFTVIENQDNDLLLGLDMLLRFIFKEKCIVDLSQNLLQIGDKATSFLSEKDIGSARLGAHQVYPPITTSQSKWQGAAPCNLARSWLSSVTGR